MATIQTNNTMRKLCCAITIFVVLFVSIIKFLSPINVFTDDDLKMSPVNINGTPKRVVCLSSSIVSLQERNCTRKLDELDQPGASCICALSFFFYFILFFLITKVLQCQCLGVSPVSTGHPFLKKTGLDAMRMPVYSPSKKTALTWRLWTSKKT